MVRDGAVREEAFDPRDIGLDLVPVEALRGADASYNADVARRLLDGETGPVRDAVLLNTAAALVALGPGDGTLNEQLAAGIAKAAASIDSGAAKPGAGALGRCQQRLSRTGESARGAVSSFRPHLAPARVWQNSSLRSRVTATKGPARCPGPSVRGGVPRVMTGPWAARSTASAGPSAYVNPGVLVL